MASVERHESAPEIDLVDIWVLLRRYLPLFTGVFVASVIAGAVIVLMVPVKYTYSLVVNVSGIRNVATGAFEPVFTADAETAALQNSIIPTVLRADVAKYPEAGLEKAIVDVKVIKDGSLVTLSTKGTLRQGATLRAVLSDIVLEMGKEQDAIIKNKLDATKMLLGAQIADLSSQLASAQNSRHHLVTHGTQTEKVFTLLLIDHQIVQLQQNLFALRQRLNVDLPTELQLTQSVRSPERSVRPTSVGKFMLIGTVIVVALILGLFAVFMANLIATAEERRNSSR